MSVRPPINWPAIAAQLAAVVQVHPCTCMKKVLPWPSLNKEHKDHTCRRCLALAAFDLLKDWQLRQFPYFAIVRANLVKPFELRYANVKA